MIDKIVRASRMFLEGLIRNVGGRLGWWLRYQYYSRVLGSCGRNVRIDEGVFFYNPENIEIGSNVWISPYTIITSRSGFDIDPESHRILKKRNNPGFKGKLGKVIIGNNVSIGAYNIIQGWGGLVISDCFTSSARVSIYSFSHYPCDDNQPEKVTYANPMVDEKENISCIQSPVMIERNVWLGLNVIVFGGTIGRNTFVATGSVVLGDLPENSYAIGSPAKKIKPRFAEKVEYAKNS